MTVSVLVNCLSVMSIFYETFNSVGDKGISEHVGDDIKVVRNNI